VSCTALGGIHEGTLGGADSGPEGGDGTLPDSSPPTGDSAADAIDASTRDASGRDATADAYDADASTQGDTAVPPVACTLVPFTTVLVDDLSRQDGGLTTYTGTIGIVPVTDVTTTAVVAAQLAGDENEFLAYEVDLARRTAQPAAPLTGFAQEGGIELVATVPDPHGFGNAVLTTYRTGKLAIGYEEGLQIFTLPDRSGFPFANHGYPLANPGPFRINSAAFSPSSASAATWIVAGTAESSFTGMIFVGGGSAADGSSAGVVVAQSTQTFYQLVNPQIFEVGGTFYALVAGVVDGGTTVFEVPGDFSDAGGQGLIANAGGTSLVLGAHPSAANASQVVVLAGAQTVSGAFATYGATVDPSQLGSLVIGQPPFVENPPISPRDLPLYTMTQAWADDELFLFGGPGDKSTGATLVWMGADGHIVSSSATSGGGPIVTATSPIVASAIAAQDHFQEDRADLLVAWVVRNTDGAGAQFDRLYAAQVLCEP
jgi:hypothetical protein